MKRFLYGIAAISLFLVCAIAQKAAILPGAQDAKDLNRASAAGTGTGTTIIT